MCEAHFFWIGFPCLAHLAVRGHACPTSGTEENRVMITSTPCEASTLEEGTLNAYRIYVIHIIFAILVKRSSKILRANQSNELQ